MNRNNVSDIHFCFIFFWLIKKIKATNLFSNYVFFFFFSCFCGLLLLLLKGEFNFHSLYNSLVKYIIKKYCLSLPIYISIFKMLN